MASPTHFYAIKGNPKKVLWQTINNEITEGESVTESHKQSLGKTKPKKEKMRAYVFKKNKKTKKITLAMSEVERPVIEEEDFEGAAIIQVTHVSVCRTDVSQYKGQLGEEVNGNIPGHEVRGKVIAVKKTKDGKCPVSVNDHIVYFGGTDFGGLAEFKKIKQCIVPSTEHAPVFWTDRFFFDPIGAAIVKLKDENELKDSATILEPLTCVLRAMYAYPPSPGDTAVVIGVGPIGSLAIQVMKNLFGVAKVIALDIMQSRLDRVKNIYGVEVYNLTSKEDKKQIIKMVNDKTGKIAQYAFEALPPDHDKVEDARYYGALLLSPLGKYILFSAQGVQEKTNFWWLVLAKNLNICAAGFDAGAFSMQKSAAVLERALNLVRNNVIDIESVLKEKEDGKLNIVDFNNEKEVIKTFDTYGETDVLKTVIKFSNKRKHNHNK